MFFLFDRFFNQVLLIVRIDFDSNLSLPDLKQNLPNCYKVTNYITFAENLSTVLDGLIVVYLPFSMVIIHNWIKTVLNFFCHLNEIKI